MICKKGVLLYILSLEGRGLKVRVRSITAVSLWGISFPLPLAVQAFYLSPARLCRNPSKHTVVIPSEMGRKRDSSPYGSERHSLKGREKPEEIALRYSGMSSKKVWIPVELYSSK
jgi:hypothetical protein